ncbi:lysozyme family protein [Enterococcus cecorum]
MWPITASTIRKNWQKNIQKRFWRQLLGNTEGKRYRYLHIFSIFHNGGYLYHNGGNYYYAKIVKWNQYQYESYEKIIHLIE